MLWRKLTSWLPGRRPSNSLGAIQPASRFREIVDRERKRTERTSGTFSLLELTLGRDEVRTAQVAGLARIFSQRLRATDVAGFLDNQRIGVVLSGTGEERAWEVAEDILEKCTPFRAPKCAVYVYPTRPWSGDNQFNDTSDETRTGDRQGQSVEALMFVKPLPLWKRAIDMIGASSALFFLWPLFAVVAIIIKRTSKGPVFFLQKREGLGGKIFTLYKFRTMVVDAEEQKAALRKQSEQDGPAFKMKHDPRITSCGRYLRKTCIDELPQLLNVLKGDMSLVGPRPLPVDESQQCTTWQRRRLEVTPGLTCFWQVDGKSRVPFVEWMRMDIRYIKARNIYQDVKLVVRTAIAVVLHRASH